MLYLMLLLLAAMVVDVIVVVMHDFHDRPPKAGLPYHNISQRYNYHLVEQRCPTFPDSRNRRVSWIWTSSNYNVGLALCQFMLMAQWPSKNISNISSGQK